MLKRMADLCIMGGIHLNVHRYVRSDGYVDTIDVTAIHDTPKFQ